MTDYQYKFIPHFGQGLNRYQRADIIDDAELRDMLNVRARGGALEIRKGYTDLSLQFSTGLVSNVEEMARKTVEFDLSDGTSKILAFTTHAVYEYAAEVWTQIETDDSAAFTADAGTDTLTSASHGLSNANKVKVISATTLPAGLANSIIYYVVGATTNTFQLSLAEAGAAIDITDAGTGVHTFIPCLSGDTALPLKTAVFTPLDALVFTNSADVIKVYINDGPGYAIRDLAGLTSGSPIGVASAVTKCRDLIVWNNRLWLFYTTEDGNDLPQMIRWSDVADIEEWSQTGDADGGYFRLSDRDDSIQTVARLGQVLIVYRDHSIVGGTYIGSSGKTVDFNEMISEEGVLGPGSVADFGDYHIFFGWHNIYRFNGGRSIDPIGDRIFNLVFGVDGVADIDRPTDIVVRRLRSTREVWCSVLVGTSYTVGGVYATYKSMVLVYNTIDDAWSRYEFGDASNDVRISDISEIRLGTTLTWDELELTWEELGDLRWDTQALASGFPNVLLCSKWKILNYNHIEGQDEGSDVVFLAETKDLITTADYNRSYYVEIDTEGGGCSVSYSLDRGVNYTSLGTISAHTSLTRDKLFIDASFKTIRFKITGTGGGFKLGSLGMAFDLESEF